MSMPTAFRSSPRQVFLYSEKNKLNNTVKETEKIRWRPNSYCVFSWHRLSPTNDLSSKSTHTLLLFPMKTLFKHQPSGPSGNLLFHTAPCTCTVVLLNVFSPIRHSRVCLFLQHWILNLQKKLSNFLEAKILLPESLAPGTEARDLWFTSQNQGDFFVLFLFLLFLLDPWYTKRIGLGNTGGHGGSVWEGTQPAGSPQWD